MSPRDFSAVSAYLATAEAPSRAILAERAAERAGLDAACLPRELEEEIDRRWEAILRAEVAQIDEDVRELQDRRATLVAQLPPPPAHRSAMSAESAHERAALVMSLWRWEAATPHREGGTMRSRLGGYGGYYGANPNRMEATYLHGEGRNNGRVVVEGTMKGGRVFSHIYDLPVDATPSKVSARHIRDALGTPQGIEIRKSVRQLLVNLLTEAS